MRYPSHDDWVYAAGLLDGEGSIGVYQANRQRGRERSPVFIARASLINTDEAIMCWLQDVFGGRVTPRKRFGLRRRCFVWALDGQGATDFLRKIGPYLRIKQKQAWLLQEAWANRGNLRRGDDAEEVAALRRGFVLASAYLNQGGQ